MDPNLVGPTRALQDPKSKHLELLQSLDSQKTNYKRSLLFGCLRLLLAPLGAVEELCRWIVAFPVCTRNFLRSKPFELDELEGAMECAGPWGPGVGGFPGTLGAMYSVAI